jgi:hypothetical protein
MKKIIFRGALLLISASTLCTSCAIGSFAMFNKFAKWNSTATGNKYINAIIGFVCSPVYSICLFADFVVLNSIEFWTGDQLLANAGKTTPMVGTNGDFYLLTTTETGYTISNETTKQVSYLRYDKESNLWSYEVNGETNPLVKINADNTLTVYTAEGKELVVTNDANGLEQVKALVNPTVPFMAAN